MHQQKGQNTVNNKQKNKIKLNVEIPDIAYWKRQISCQDACPVHTDARGYVRAIADGNYDTGYRIARGPNPLASICGRICQAPCEDSCRRAAIDSPVSIRALKRFVTERFGAEANKKNPAAVIESVRMISSSNASKDEVAILRKAQSDGLLIAAGDKRIAIIGGGPAGLACAHDLALFGFKPVIFEMEHRPAGMLYTGIPAFRLPRDIIEAEINVLVDLGVEIQCNTTVGEHILFDQIKNEFDAIVIAVGAKNSKGLGIPGEDAIGVHGGVEFLRRCSLGHDPGLGEHIVVVGGGFTALDCSRSSLRFGASDVVTVLYRRTRDEMPVTQQEIDEAHEEGVDFQYLVAPLSIEKDTEGHVVGIKLQQNRLGPPDASGRRRPEPIPGSEFVQPCDTVIRAIGQDSDMAFINPARDGLAFNDWGLVDCDEETLSTKVPGIYMAGDAAYGTQLVIDAVASGKLAAQSVYQYLTGKQVLITTRQSHIDLSDHTREIGFEKIPRTALPVADSKIRVADHSVTVELGYDEVLAKKEASRCFDCGINTIFDGTKCILCSGCVDVCPTNCLKLVSLTDLNLTDEQINKAKECLGDQHDHGSAIIKDEEACIRCALCSKWCPTGTITMERMEFSEEWS
jgi:NADPH-dependent glutamate synthase beta subunit-like oxidoreductase